MIRMPLECAVPKAAADTPKTLVASPERCHEMEIAGRRLAEERFSDF